MGPELRKVADTIMSDLGMGEDQGKIDALEQYLEENLAAFFSEDSYMSSVIKMGAEKSFTSHSANYPQQFLQPLFEHAPQHSHRSSFLFKISTVIFFNQIYIFISVF